MSSEDAMQFMPLAAVRTFCSRMTVKIGAAMLGSAVLGLLLGQVLFGREQDKAIPLDEWQPLVAQAPASGVEAEPQSSGQEPSVAADVPAAAPAPRAPAYSAVQQFSDLLYVPAAKIPTSSAQIPASEDKPQRVAKDGAPTHSPKPTIRSKPRPVPAATAARPPEPSPSPATQTAGTEAAKDEDAGVMQKSYQAIASAPSKVWSTTRDAAKSVASFGGAAWERIKP